VNRQELQTLAEERLADARAVLEAGRWDGAYYLAGYAVECALKAYVARQTKEYDFPVKDAGSKFYIHDLEKLCNNARLTQVIEDESRRDREFGLNWLFVKDWKEEARYETHSRQKAEQMLAAVGDPQHGVLQCLRRYW
jgi:HEPN domain-containing protein